MKKYICLAICFFVITSITAFAEISVSYTTKDNGTIYINILNEDIAAKDIVLRVPKDKMQEYNTQTEYLVFKQIRVQGNTSIQFSVEFPKSAQSGIYYLDISGEDEDYVIYHNNSSSLTPYLGLLNGDMTLAQLENAMNTIKKYAAFDNDEYETNKDKILKWMLLFKPKSSVDFDTFFEMYYSAVAMANIEGNTSENVLSILLEHEVSANLSLEKLLSSNETIIDEVCQSLADTSLKLSSIEKYIDNYLILSTLYNALSWQELESMITVTYKTALGIDTTAYSGLKYHENVIKNMYKVRYDSLEDVKSAFNSGVNAQKAAENNSSKGPVGGGGGSGASGGYGNVNFDSEIPSATVDKFKDVGLSHWAKEPIEFLTDKGILSGVGDGRFLPDNSVSRAEFVKMIVGAFFSVNNDIKNEFSDISENDWYYSYVKTAADLGIITGTSKGVFAPNNQISREDMAVITMRTMGKLGKELIKVREYNAFEDDDIISDYAALSVKQLFNAGIINGVSGTIFSPKEALTRAQAAKIIFELLNR